MRELPRSAASMGFASYGPPTGLFQICGSEGSQPPVGVSLIFYCPALYLNFSSGKRDTDSVAAKLMERGVGIEK
jgi:hypothetical protein